MIPKFNDMKTDSAVSDVLQPFVERHELAGAVVLVADKNRILSLDAIGFSDATTRIAMPTDAMFWIASQTKPMTATALMMLVDEGRVAIEDPVEKYLPEFAGQMMVVERDEDHVLLRKPPHPITVKNVLNHTSGMPFLSPLEQPTIDGLALRDAVRSYAMAPLEFAPDTQYLYSNQGTNTAGRIIEVVSGAPYEEWMQARLFDPLEMSDTTFWPDARQLQRLAKVHAPDEDESGSGLITKNLPFLRYPLDDATRQPVPAGGLFSTATDVARFCRMILNGGELDDKRLLSPNAIAEMTRRQTLAGLESYGLGWSVGEHEFGHGGACSTNMTINTRHDLVTVFLVQHEGFPGNGSQSHEMWKEAVLARFKTND